MHHAGDHGDQPTPLMVGGNELFGAQAVSVACAGGREGGTVVVTETGTVWMSDLVGRDGGVQRTHT